jgi:hypothetical protein
MGFVGSDRCSGAYVIFMFVRADSRQIMRSIMALEALTSELGGQLEGFLPDCTGILEKEFDFDF